MNRIETIYEQAGVAISRLDDRYPITFTHILTAPLLRKLTTQLREKLEAIGLESTHAECTLGTITVMFKSVVSDCVSAKIQIGFTTITARVFDVSIHSYDIDEYTNGPIVRYGYDISKYIVRPLEIFEQLRATYMERCRKWFAPLHERLDMISRLLPQPIAEEIAHELSIKHVRGDRPE